MMRNISDEKILVFSTGSPDHWKNSKNSNGYSFLTPVYRSSFIQISPVSADINTKILTKIDTMWTG